jgi:sulfide:quinone oxidoreductase
MMEIAPGVLVAPQISPADVERAAQAGVRTIIQNRPDGEEPGQASAAEIGAAAEALGLRFLHIPVFGGAFPPEAAAAMARAIEGSDGAVLAFCRSGARSATLWALGRAGRDTPDAIIAAGRRAGLDLEPLRGRLEARHAEAAQ